MLDSKTFLSYLIKSLRENKIEHIFCSNSLIQALDKPMKSIVTQANDVRGMTYMACGTSSLTKQPVVVIVNGDNESRNLFSGLTEAYYRNLPIIAIIFSGKSKLNYTKILEDCSHEILTLSSDDSPNIIKNRVKGVCNSILKFNLPIIINCFVNENYSRSIHSNILDDYKDVILSIDKLLASDDYLFVAQDVIITNTKLKHKFYSNIGAFGNNGIISTTLGAALSKIHKTYYCILSYDDFINDINSLGNRHFPSNIIIVLFSREKHKLISDYCNSLNIDYRCTSNLDKSYIKNNKSDSRALVIEMVV